MDKVNLDKNSELIIAKVINTTIDREGRKIKEFQEFRVDEPVSLGSIKEPLNQDIIAFEWRDTTPQERKRNIFGGFR